MQKNITVALLLAVIVSTAPTYASAKTKPQASGSLAVSACVIGSASSTIHPHMKNICDSRISWTTTHAQNAYTVITGGSPYLTSIYPYGYTTPGGVGLQKSGVPFWTPAGTYTVSLYANGTFPTQKKPGTGVKLAERTIMVLPYAEKSLTETNLYVAKNNVATLKQPKGWRAYDAAKNHTRFLGMSATQVEFYANTPEPVVMKFGRVDNVKGDFAVSSERAVELLEMGYTKRISARVHPMVQMAEQVTGYLDVAQIRKNNDNGRFSTLVSKKPLTVNGASGYMLTFSRKTSGGQSEIMQHTILKKGNSYYEVVVTAPKNVWPQIQASVDASIKTLNI